MNELRRRAQLCHSKVAAFSVSQAMKTIGLWVPAKKAVTGALRRHASAAGGEEKAESNPGTSAKASGAGERTRPGRS